MWTARKIKAIKHGTVFPYKSSTHLQTAARRGNQTETRVTVSNSDVRTGGDRSRCVTDVKGLRDLNQTWGKGRLTRDDHFKPLFHPACWSSVKTK